MTAGDSTTWERVPIVDLCTEHVDCVNRTAPVVDEPTPFKMIRTTNVRNGFIDTENVRYVTEETYKRWTRRLVPKQGDVILTREAPLGDVGKIRTHDLIFLGQRLYHFRPDPKKLDPDFLLYALMAPDLQGQIKAFGSGSTVEHMRLGDIPSLEVNVPPLSVQRRIAGILSAYDDLIDNNHRRIKILEEMARSLYREWFVHFRFPGHDKVKMVPSSLGPLPQGWEVVSIDDVCEQVTDGSHSSPKSAIEGMPMASSKDMHDWGFTMKTCRLISREDFDELVRNNCKPKKNDVLITKDGANYLKHIFVNREERDVVLLSSIAILRPSARVNPYLLAATLSAPETKARLKNYVTGAAIPRIILKDFKRFEFLLPSQQVQVEWAKHAEPMTKLCRELVDQIHNLRCTRDLLLPRLLSEQIILADGGT